MSIKDDSKELNSSLKESTRSARGLAYEMAGVQAGLGRSVKEAAALAEALAKMSKIEGIAEKATGIGAVVGLLATGLTLFFGWKEKAKEIENSAKNIRLEIEGINAAAGKGKSGALLGTGTAGDDRLAQMKKIELQEQKEIQALEKEENAMIRLNKHLYNYGALREAIHARAVAQTNELNQNIRRQFEEEGFSIDDRTSQHNAVIYNGDPNEVQRNIARIGSAAEERKVNANKLYSPEQKAALVKQIKDELDAAILEIEYTTTKRLGDQLGQSFAGSIADGIAKGVQSGSIQEGFRAMTGGLLIGFGQLMVTIGTQSLLAANLMQGIVHALQTFAPAGAIAPSLALIALGGVLMGLGAGMGGRGSTGGSGGGGSFGASSSTTIIDRGLINPANGVVVGPGMIVPAAPRTTNVWLIGKDDPRAQRDLYDMVNSAGTRNGDK